MLQHARQDAIGVLAQEFTLLRLDSHMLLGTL